jgi:hypothetical protein
VKNRRGGGYVRVQVRQVRALDSFILIPIESTSAPFVFEEISADYQTVSIQGEVIFKIADTGKARDQINFSVSPTIIGKLGQRIVNVTKTIAKKEIEQKA